MLAILFIIFMIFIAVVVVGFFIGMLIKGAEIARDYAKRNP